MLIINIGESAHEYVTSLAAREIAWIKGFAVPRPVNDPLYISESQNSPTEHIALLQKFLAIAPGLLPSAGNTIKPFLWHTDLHANNVFVDEVGKITCIIDWQSSWAGPLFIEARQPQFLRYDGELMLELPKDFKQFEPNVQTEIREKVARSILAYLYEINTAKENPLLNEILHFPNGKTRTRPFVFVGDTWNGEILPLRESLIKIERYVATPRKLARIGNFACYVPHGLFTDLTFCPCPLGLGKK